MEKDNFISIVNKFEGKKIAVIGDSFLDEYVFGRVERINPERASATLHKVEKRDSRLGGAGNVAANTAALGAITFLFGVIGEDREGEKFNEICNSKGIIFMPVYEGATIVKQRHIELAHYDHLLRADYGELNLGKLGIEKEEELFKKITSDHYDAIIFSDYNKRIFRGDLSQRIINWANRLGIPTFVDPKPQNINSFKNATVIRPNEIEAREIVKDNKIDIKEVSKKLKEITQSKYVIVTRGKQGMVCYDGDYNEIQTKAKDVVDVTGSGDTVIATLALSMISGANLVDSSHIANYAAGVVVEKAGTATLTKEELIQIIKEDAVNDNL